MTGLMVPEFYDNISFFVPIVRDVIETADRDKMVYQRAYVEDDKQFLLRKSYFISGGNYIIMDRGRAISLTIDTEPFQELTDIKIQPFETAPFVNKHKTKARELATNHYTRLSSGQMVLIQDYKERIEGVVEELDKGTMASFDLGFDKYDEVTTLEVHNG